MTFFGVDEITLHLVIFVQHHRVEFETRAYAQMKALQKLPEAYEKSTKSTHRNHKFFRGKV